MKTIVMTMTHGHMKIFSCIPLPSSQVSQIYDSLIFLYHLEVNQIFRPRHVWNISSLNFSFLPLKVLQGEANILMDCPLQFLIKHYKYLTAFC